MGPLSIPELSDKEAALKDPELAVLSAMAHAKDPDTMKSARIASLAQMACVELDTERSMLYCDLILSYLPEAARQALQTMNASKYEYQSEFARRYYGQGKAEGRAEGRVEGRAEGRLEGLMQGHAEGHTEGQAEGRMELVLKLLVTKYGFLPAAMAARVRKANGAYVDEIAARVLTAETLDEALGLSCAQS
jgi:flagellar biosynthesis/type III secretory pathway protein FliH